MAVWTLCSENVWMGILWHFKWLYLAHYGVDLHQTRGFCESRCALSDYVDQ